MWCNQKLMEAGENFSFSIDGLAEEFSNGVNVATMLRILATARRVEEAKQNGQSTDGIAQEVGHYFRHVKDIRTDDGKKMLSVFCRENLNKCWRFMTQEENIKLGGVNVPNIMSATLKTVLALVFRWVRTYDMAEGGYSELLEWVKSKTGKYIQVTGWSSSMNDGIAFMELYSNLCEDDFKETVGTMEDVLNMTDEERLTLAFRIIEDGPLGVSQMLTVNDLSADHLDKDHKDQLMTYVSAIRAAHKKWYPEYLQSLEEKGNASKNALSDGDAYYKVGLQKFSNAREKSDPVIEQIRTEICEEMRNDSNPDYETYTVKAQEKYVEMMPEYDVSIENFTNAIDEYKKVDHVDVTDKLANCDQKIVEVNEHRDEKKNWLADEFRTDIQIDKAYKMYITGSEHLDVTVTEGTNFINDVITETVTKIKESDRPEVREQLQKDAERKAQDWLVHFDPVRDELKEAEDLFPDNVGKKKCRTKIEEIEITTSEFMEMMNIEIAKVLEESGQNDVLFEDELLQLYHDTTVAIDKLVNDRASDPGLAQITKNPTKTKDRLDTILKEVQGVWGDSDNLRQKVHDRIDAIFNANGYDCKKGTDCCDDCKAA